MNNKIKASAMDSVTELSPKVKRSRSTFNLNIKTYTSFNVGELVPLDWTEVLPGDTFNVDLATFIRLTSPAKRPTMDNLHMDIYAFFVPYRFLDKGWTHLQGENTDPWAVTPGATSTFYFPSAGGVQSGSLLNHLGLPVFQVSSDAGYDPTKLKFNIYPVYTYLKVINDWFRDENLQAELPFDTTNNDYSVTADITQINSKYIYEKGSLFKVAKYHDVFTSALPAPQKGPAVSLIKGNAPVGVIPSTSGTATSSSTMKPLWSNGQTYTAGSLRQVLSASSDSNLHDLGFVADLSKATVSTINELRLAFQLQKAYELDARSGTRYTEALEARFSVKNPDLRLGRSELLGHYRFDLSMAEVQTNGGILNSDADTLIADSAAGYSSGVGAGSSKTGNSQHICVKSFLEHGIFMIVGCVRPDLTYQQGVDKFWRKTQRWDFYEPIFSNIGEVPIMKSEILSAYATSNDLGWSQDSVFGYQEAWYEYRYKNSHISGILESASNEGFDIFHYGMDFNGALSLGSDFIQQSSAAVDRTLLFTSSAVDNFICNVAGVIKATRVMPLFSVPGLIDHF